MPSGGILRIRNATGEVIIEGWDKPEVEITTIKSTQYEYLPDERARATAVLDRIRVTTELHGDELVVTTAFPRHRAFPPPSPVGKGPGFDLEYRIRVPRGIRLAIDHNNGEVHLADISGEVNVESLQGEISVLLPADTAPAIDAKSDVGSVTTDFPGKQTHLRWRLGQQLMREAPSTAQKLHLRVGYGDILILKSNYPQPTAATAP